jgi:hypothetical protein
MSHIPPRTWRDEDQLAVLAARFRSTRDVAQREAIAHEYAESVRRLIRGGNWVEAPPPDEQLPYDWMPREFFSYWMSPEDAPYRSTPGSP